MIDAVVESRRPKWDAVVLVCKDCGKRKRAPKDAKPKKLASLLRTLTKREPSRPRIVLTPCLGLCPKEATAVAVTGHALPSRIAAICGPEQLAAWTTATFAPPVTSAPATLLPGTPPSDDR